MSSGNGSTAIELAKPVDLLPALSIAQSVERRNQMVQFVQAIMEKGRDFGPIPGTDKPTLLKPGAEKLCTFFGLTKQFEIIERTEDWTGKEHGGEPFFYYLYRCKLLRGDKLIAESDGSANSFETKYRWRSAKRVCPACGKPAIIKGKADYGGGWLCFKKQDGCGAKFAEDDKAITDQQVGRIPNADIADQVNTLQKMAQKRALVGTTLLAVNASEFFTQDVEDMQPIPGGAPAEDVIDAEYTETPRKPARVVEDDRSNRQPYGDTGPDLSDDATFITALADEFDRRGFSEVQRELAAKDILKRGYKVETLQALNVSQRQGMLEYVGQGKADKFKQIEKGIQPGVSVQDLPDPCSREAITEIAVSLAPKDIDAQAAADRFDGWLASSTSKQWGKLSRDEKLRVFRAIKNGDPWHAAVPASVA
jgi:hypothetical protein